MMSPDRKGALYIASAVMIAGGAVAWIYVLLPLLRLLGFFE
jgi:hypothetical protein